MQCPGETCEWNKEGLCSRNYMVIIVDNTRCTEELIGDRSISNIKFTCLSAHKEEFKDMEDARINGTSGFVAM